MTFPAAPRVTPSPMTLAASPTPIRSIRPAVILPVMLSLLIVSTKISQNDSTQGLGNNKRDYQKLDMVLQGYNVPTVVADVSRLDWLRNAAGLTDVRYWQGVLRPRPVLDWYLKRVDEAIDKAKNLSKGSTVSIVGHSAGGWLARVYMEEYGLSDISLLLTLGTPHKAPPKGVPGVVDQTRGLLNYVQKYCGEAVYSPELRYVCIAGRYIEGERINGGGGGESRDASMGDTIKARIVGQGYKQVCGRADVWGDGVVPEEAARLDGAVNITLDGVYHSPVGSDDDGRLWYGSPSVVQKWIDHLLQ